MCLLLHLKLADGSGELGGDNAPSFAAATFRPSQAIKDVMNIKSAHWTPSRIHIVDIHIVDRKATRARCQIVLARDCLTRRNRLP